MAKIADKIKASTQGHLDIDDITDDMIILKTGWVAMVMSTTAVNFDILSEAEQDATIYAYGAFLNSLTFPLQTLIRSKRADITVYYQHLVDAERQQQNPDLKIQMQKYREFIKSTVQQKTILDKRFYFVLHFSAFDMGAKSMKAANVANAKSKQSLIADAKVAIAPKRDHIIKQTARLGLFTRQLSTQELIELFYDIYNPAPTGTQRVILDAESYTAPLVEPAIETPTPAPEKVEPIAVPIPAAVTPEIVAENMAEPNPVMAPIPSLINTEISGQTPMQNGPIIPQLPIILSNSGNVEPVANGNLAGPVGDAATTPVNSSQDVALKSLQEAVSRAAGMAQKG